MPTIRLARTVFPRDISARVTRVVRITSVALFASCLIAATAFAQSISVGTWKIRGYTGAGTPGMVDLRLETQSSDHDFDDNSFDLPLASLAGLTADWLTGPDGDVRFRLVRDAGTFACEGRAGRGQGAGTFQFTPDPNFGTELAKRGYNAPSPTQQFQLAVNDVGYALLDELHTQGYTRPSISTLVELGMHDVTLEYVRGLNALGYRVGDADRLIELRDHGVTPDYIRALADAGYSKLSSRELLTLRDHGVTPRYIAELGRLGYKNLSTDDLLAVRDHGVTPSWAEGFQRIGYTQLSVQDLVELRDHGVTPAFAENMHRDGGPLPTVRQLINRRDRGSEG